MINVEHKYTVEEFSEATYPLRKLTYGALLIVGIVNIIFATIGIILFTRSADFEFYLIGSGIFFAIFGVFLLSIAINQKPKNYVKTILKEAYFLRNGFTLSLTTGEKESRFKEANSNFESINVVKNYSAVLLIYDNYIIIKLPARGAFPFPRKLFSDSDIEELKNTFKSPEQAK